MAALSKPDQLHGTVPIQQHGQVDTVQRMEDEKLLAKLSIRNVKD